MNPRHFAALLSLVSLTAQADVYDDYCRSDLPEAPKELLAKIKALESSFKIKNLRTQTFFRAAQESAKKLWTCSAKNEQTLRYCCHQIPVRLTVAGNRCLVGLPYGRLEVQRNAMDVPRFLVWDLQGPAAMQYSFGRTIPGIELVPVAGASAPVANPHYFNGNRRRYSWDSAGYKDDQSGHLPAVFPNGLVDSITDRCGDYDPLIINTD